MAEFQPREACAGYLTDARLAPADLLEQLDALARDFAGIGLPFLRDPKAALARRHTREQALLARIHDLRVDAGEMPVAEEVECGYDGEVPEVHYHRMAGIVSWDCPRCSTHREEDVDTEPDPDDARDAMLDRLHEPWDEYASDHPDHSENQGPIQ